MGDYRFGPDILAVYDAIRSSPGAQRSVLLDSLDLQPEDVTAAIDQLLELELVETGEDGGLSAVAVTSVVLRTGLAVNEAITVGQRHARRLSLLVSNLDALRTIAGAATTERLATLESVRHTIADLAAQAQFEILTSQPGGPRPDRQLRDSLGLTKELFARGVKMRTLYQWSAQFSRTTSEFVEYVTGLGAEVRITQDAFMRLLVFDRKTALLPLRQSPNGAIVVRDLDIINFAVQAYERTWTVSHPFPVSYVKDAVMVTSDSVKLSIMRLLAEGHEVSVIGKRLGISARTCQRHISEIMQRIGARNRFHAGYLISEKGLLKEPS